jgi:hypothetical protein
MPTIAAAVLAAAFAGCGSDGEPTASTTSVALPAPSTTSTAGEAAAAAPEPAAPAPEPAEPPGPSETATDDPRVNARERQAANTVRAYIEALDARDGEGVCSLLAPAALAGFEFPRPRSTCAASIEASLGYRDPRGLPVWERSRPRAIRVAELGGDGRSAKVVATVATSFADRPEESIEDDVVYLVGAQGRWLVAKPSSTLYRAVGIADVPPSVLSPPN